MLKQVFIGMIRAYQWALRPILPPACRFYPSCSDYALASVRQFGPGRGVFRALRRLLRCHPWNPGGYDPVGGGSTPRNPAAPGRVKN